MNIFIYIRASTPTQNLTYESQELKCRDQIERDHPGSQALVFKDCCTGGKEPFKRSGFKEMKSQLHSGDKIYFASLDRLSRDMGHFTQIRDYFRDNGICFRALDLPRETPPTNKNYTLEYRLMESAEEELVKNSQRTRDAMSLKKRKGEKLGGNPPMGKKTQDGLWIDDPREQAIIKKLKSWRADGLTLSAIHERCAAEGIHNRRGNPPSIHSLSRWLRDIKPQHVKKKTRGKGRIPLESQNELLVPLIKAWGASKTQAQVCELLANEDIRTTSGKALDPRQLRRILRRNP